MRPSGQGISFAFAVAVWRLEGGQFTAKSRMRQAEFKALRRVMMRVGNKPIQSDAPGNGMADLVR